jgi:hypothetical protein
LFAQVLTNFGLFIEEKTQRQGFCYLVFKEQVYEPRCLF